MLTTNPPAAPFLPARWYSVGQLRAVSKEILERTRADADFAARMRVQDQKAIPWSKSWQEEIYPCSLLADRISLTDDDTFYWTPDGAADVEFRASGKALRVQCTMAFAERPDFVGKQGGHLRKLEVKHANVEGFSFPGGFVSRPRARSEENELDEWRAGIVKALRNKIKPTYSRCWLLIFAPRCGFDTIEYDFDNVVAPAVEEVGRPMWEAVFDGLFILDTAPVAFVALAKQTGNIVADDGCPSRAGSLKRLASPQASS